MRRHLLVSLVLACAASCALAQTGYVTVSSAHLVDFSGNPLSNATISFTPVNNQGQPISAQIGAAGGGQGITTPVAASVSAGVFSVSLADTAFTNPVNVCYQTTVTDNSTGNVLMSYPCVQPASSGQAWCSGSSCNFDHYIPPTPAGTVVAVGPQGTPGVAGTNCASGSSPSECDFNGILGLIGSAPGTKFGMVTDARAFGIYPSNSAAQNQTDFAALAAAVNAGTTSAHIYLPDGTYNVLSTGSTALGVYNVAIDFECASWNTIINQTGTGNLIQPGPSGYIPLTSVNFWSPSVIHKCQFTGGASANAGIFYPGGADGLIVEFNYFYNWGGASNWAILSTGSNELELLKNSYMRTDGVLGNFSYQPFSFYNITWARDNRVVCTVSTVNGASVPCGAGITTDGDLDAQGNTMSGPNPAFRCVGNSGAVQSNTCNISNNLLEATGGSGSYLIQYGTSGGSSSETVTNLAAINNTVTIASNAGAGFIGPANSHAGLVNADVSMNHLRNDSISTQPAVTLNNLTGQTGNQGTGNTRFTSLHTSGANINNWYTSNQFYYGNVFYSDNGQGSQVLWPVATGADDFLYSFLTSNWTIQEGAFSVASNQYTGNAAGDSLAYFSPIVAPANQYAEEILTFAAGGGGAGNYGVAVRVQSGSASGYVLNCDLTPECAIYKVTSGTKTLLGSVMPISVLPNHAIALTVVGNTITAYYDQAAFETVADSTYTTGQPGIFASNNTGNVKAGYWSAGTLGGPGAGNAYAPLPTTPVAGALNGGVTPAFTIGSAAGAGATTPTIVNTHDCDSYSCQFLFSSGTTAPTSGTFLTVTFTGMTTVNVRNCSIEINNDTSGVPLPLYVFTGASGGSPTVAALYAGTPISISAVSYRGKFFCFGH